MLAISKLWQDAPAVAEQTISPAGWAFLLVSCLAVTALTLWCFGRVLRLPPEE